MADFELGKDPQVSLETPAASAYPVINERMFE
jgi:hypothetical protein